MTKFLQKTAAWILAYLACYFILTLLVPMHGFQYAIHGWAWLLFAFVEFCYASILGVLDRLVRPLKIIPTVRQTIVTVLIWMGFAVSLIVTAKLLPASASYNSVPQAFALTAVIGFCSAMANAAVSRLGLNKKPDAQ